MIWFWPTVLRPVLEAMQPHTLIEVGAAGGHNTKNLLDFALERDAKVHVIDPVPGFDVDEFRTTYGESFIFHQAKSHDVLAEIERPDVVLIDGDHNWYTVFHELRLLGERAQLDERAFPVTLLHDVSWPYHRRDLYYNPSDIPVAFRQPHRKSNIVLGQRELSDEGGINGGLFNAELSGGAHNGVLTAVEEYIEGSDEDFVLRIVHGFSGLGLLAPKSILAANAAVRREFQRTLEGEFLFEHTQRLEEMAIRNRADAVDARRALRKRELAHTAEIKDLQREVDRLNKQLEAVSKNRAD